MPVTKDALSKQEETAQKRLSNLILFLRGEIPLRVLRQKIGKPLPEGLQRGLSLDGFRPKLSQMALGEKLGCSYAGVQGWEANRAKGGNSFPRLVHFMRLAEEANLGVDELTQLLFDYTVPTKTLKTPESVAEKIERITTLIREINITEPQNIAKLLAAIIESCLPTSDSPEKETLFFYPEPPEKKYCSLEAPQAKQISMVLLESLKLNSINPEDLIDSGVLASTVFDSLMLALEEKTVESELVTLQIEETQLNQIATLCCKVRGWVSEDGELAIWLNPKKHYADFRELLIDLSKQANAQKSETLDSSPA